MSHIVDALILSSYEDEPAIRAMNETLASEDADRHQGFGEVETNTAGGSKGFCAQVYAGAFNHVPVPQPSKSALHALRGDHPRESCSSWTPTTPMKILALRQQQSCAPSA